MKMSKCRNIQYPVSNANGNWNLAFAALAILATFTMAFAVPVAAGETFPVEGKMLVGVNFWGSKAGVRMWRADEWDEASIEKDVSALAATGVELMRVFPTWSEFQPLMQEKKYQGAPALLRNRQLLILRRLMSRPMMQTSSSIPNSFVTRFEPIKPAAPVTKTFFILLSNIYMTTRLFNFFQISGYCVLPCGQRLKAVFCKL